jgi:hypothetical protein
MRSERSKGSGQNLYSTGFGGLLKLFGAPACSMEFHDRQRFGVLRLVF